MEKKKLLISFSGGRTSAYMTWWLMNEWKERDLWEMIVVFANTGKEREETLDFIERCDKEFRLGVTWVEAVTYPHQRKGVSAKVVSFDTASRNGEPFEAMIAKHGIPNPASPHCTRELKAQAIKSYAKNIGWKKYYTAIGIRGDEIDRMQDDYERKRLIYPLIKSNYTTKSDVNRFWLRQSFDLQLKSYEGNCDLCWKKTFRKLYTIAQENSSLTDWWLEMEVKYNSYIPKARLKNKEIKTPIRFYRNHTSVSEIVEQSKVLIDLAVDDSKMIIPKHFDLFEEIDKTNGCIESCEVVF